jgi:xanthine dehydrogenase YagR molybdenum-binding subunit
LGDTGLPYSTKGLDKCYELGAKAIGWERRNRQPGGGDGAGTVRHGIGVATSIWFGAGVPGTLADIVLYPDMSVEVVCGTQDLGTGTRTLMAVVAAETLGLGPKDITVKLGNSDYPWAPLSGGSLTTPSVAPAVRDAALKAVDRLKAVAAARLKVAADDVVMGDRKFFAKSAPEKTVAFADVYRDLRRETVFHGERTGFPQNEYAFNTFGAHFAEVEVDVETGRVRVLKYVAAQDSGQIVNKLTAESQVVGGVTQGLSAGLFEERIMDDTTGTVVNPNLRDYKIATSLDIPEITPLFVDVFDPRINNLGVKGLGEPARVPSSAAVANAVYNAIGVHVREIPMTPKRVLEALKKKEAGS